MILAADTTSPKRTRRIAWGRLAAIALTVALWVAIILAAHLIAEARS